MNYTKVHIKRKLEMIVRFLCEIDDDTEVAEEFIRKIWNQAANFRLKYTKFKVKVQRSLSI